MVKKLIRYGVPLILLLVVLRKSVYFEKLDEHQSLTQEFDAAGYARNYWNDKLMPALDSAVEMDSLVTLLHTDKETAFNKYSHALGIGNIRFFLVKGSGEIINIGENEVTVQITPAGDPLGVRIVTEYVFGNAVRDASAGIDINEFTNTMDFNNVSTEINKIIRTTVLPPFKSVAKKGDRVSFSGAIELNKEHLDTENIEVIPVVLKIEE